jgi:phospholipid/cholesterol/gamma-HCH transport system substrate-binding protein
MVDVDILIYNEYEEKIRENSILELVTSPIGLGTQLLFYPGRSEKLLPEHAFIPSYDTPEGKALVASELVDRPVTDDSVTRLLSNVNTTVVQLEKTVSLINDALQGKGSGLMTAALTDAATSIQGIRMLIAQVNDTVATGAPQIEQILTEVEQKLPEIVAEIQKSTQAIAAITTNLVQTSESLKDPAGLIPKLLDPKGSLKTFLDDGNQLFTRVDTSLAEVEQTLKNLQEATTLLTAQMPQIAATIYDTRSAIISAQDVLEGLKNNPLLKGGIPERVNPQSAPTGLRNGDF